MTSRHNSAPTEGPAATPRLLADGTHLFPVTAASIPHLGVEGKGVGEVRWHPARGLEFRVEAPTDLAAAVGLLQRSPGSSAGAGSVLEPARTPQLTARVVGTAETIRLYQLDARHADNSESGILSMRRVVSGTAIAATVRIERDSELSWWHETTGTARYLMPDVGMYQWPAEDRPEWVCGDEQRSSLRHSCPLSSIPALTLFSASPLPGDRHAAWLSFDQDLIPADQPDWYTPEACLAARTFTSFMVGKRLPFLWLDRRQESHLLRTYLGLAKVDDFRLEEHVSQPVPFRSLRHGGGVIPSLPGLFAGYLGLQRWYDLEWIVGPLWYANTAYLDDKLGLASVALERLATAHTAYLKANPADRPPKTRFLSRQQFRALRAGLLAAVKQFAAERRIDLGQTHGPAVEAAIDQAVRLIDGLDGSLFRPDDLGDLRAAMKAAAAEAGEAEGARLDETKQQIIDKRIDSFAEKPNADKLTGVCDFVGLSITDRELEVIILRNDCLHGRRTLEDASDLGSVAEEAARFDTLRTLIHKAVLARFGYRGPYVDYAARPTGGGFPIKTLGNELQPHPAVEEG